MTTSAEMYAPLRCSCGGEARLCCSNGCETPELENRPPVHAGLATLPPSPTGRRRWQRLADEAAIARDDEIVRRYQAGESATTIGRSFGLTSERCRQILKARGVPLVGNHVRGFRG